MPYPTLNPIAKHDLVGPTVPDGRTDDDTSSALLPTTESIINALQSPITANSSSSLLSTIYTYPDAPSKPKPLSRTLEIIGYADVALSLVRKFTDDGPLQADHMSRCTIGVKRADRPDIRSGLREKDVTNSDNLARMASTMRQRQLAAVVAADPYGRFGILRSMEDDYSGGVDTNGNGGDYSKYDYAMDLYVGDMNDIKALLGGGGISGANATTSSSTGPAEPADDNVNPFASYETEVSAPAVNNGGGETTTELWKPPGADNFGGDDAGGLWQPPGMGDNGGATSWEPTGFDNAPSSTAISGQKRPRSDSTTDDATRGDKKEGQFHANDGAATADTFYSNLVRTLDTRADSRLYHMRAFNGWVKATQIAELEPRTGSGKKGSKQPLRILDLACGKGGDLGKWTLHHRGIRNYVGVDVARGSLKDAAIRARRMRKQLRNHCTFTCADLGSDVPGRAKGRTIQKLLSWSLANEPVDETMDPEFHLVVGGGITPIEKFDVVSIQFAIHYMMQTRKRAMRFFKTVSDLLDVGGNLIVTTIDARIIMYHLMDLGFDLHFDKNDQQSNTDGVTVKVGNGACRIKFDNEILRKIFAKKDKKDEYAGKEYMNDSLYGLQYTFTLIEGEDHSAGVGEAVDLPEWLSPLPALQSLAEAAGFEMEYAKNFHEFYADRKKQSQNSQAHNALYNMKVLNRNGSISEDEWEISRLYMALKFRKVRESQLVLDEEEEEEEEANSMEQELSNSGAGANEEIPAHTNNEPERKSGDNNDDLLATNPKAKALFPMAMMKAKKIAGDEVWAELSSEEKKQRTNDELRKML